jgi:oxygen-independent coproporphyrinogen-3 oxidase
MAWTIPSAGAGISHVSGEEQAMAAGLYFHIPFCLRKCPYCDFYSRTDLTVLPSFIDALQKELVLRAESDLAVDTVYFGGGTPSLCPPEAVGEILALARSCFDLREDAEITLEANPGTLEAGTLVRLRAAGVNRLNLGVQSFREQGLQFLGRIHNRYDALTAIDQARTAGFGKLGLDLIYGLPGQTAADWRGDLEEALAVHPEHLSCYMLTFAPGTPMTDAVQAGRLQLPEEGGVAAMFESTSALLTAAGYAHYEISNYARTPDLRSRHNLKYWRFSPYLGFGPGAHSYRDGVRSWNRADLDLYRQRLAEDRRPAGGREVLTVEQQVLEALLLGLRLKEGFSIAAFEARFGIAVQATFGRLLHQLAREGCLADLPGRCALTVKGMRFHDSIAARFAATL